MKDRAGQLAVVFLLSSSLTSCGGIGVRQFLAFEAPVVALTHVRVIDGTGGPAREDQTVIIDSDKIAAVGAAAAVAIPNGAKVLDLPGRTVLPGLVGMHDHLFYQMGRQMAVPAQESFAMLYLASGVTTIRTAGALDFVGEIRLKKLIDAGTQPGPTIHLTSPYLYSVAEAPDPERAATQGTVGKFDISIYTRSRWIWLAGVLFAILVGRRLRKRFGSVPSV